MVDAKEKNSEKSDVALKEEAILDFWNKNEIFKKTLGKDAQAGNFVFFDGPPFATGLPHYGHILPGTIKDLIPRYQTMKGKRVLRRWGWDCHGLPIENLIEKELGLKSKKDIEELGVEKFNLAARNSVFRYADEWKKIIPRTGRFVDMDNDYRSMDFTYTESVWWSFKTLYDKGLVYQGFKSMLLCPHCETTLSNFEVNQGYKDISDISVYVKFELVDEPNTFVIAWTTTPWTLPGNVALAVNKDVTYAKVLKDGVNYFVAKDLVEKVFKNEYEIKAEILGDELVGKKYKPVFDYYNNDKTENIENAWKIYHGDFVTTESGTGVVHIAPAFGEDDMNLGKENNLPFIQHVNRSGEFNKEVTDFAGQKVKPKSAEGKDGEKERLGADIGIIRYLQEHGTFFNKEKIVHSYPHCWRCNTPLLNYASTSWFVKVSDMKDRLVELNKEVLWVPEEIGEGRFGKWLEGARDWAISRSRYWGAPLPVWENKEGKKYILGSISDLKNHIKKSGNEYFLIRHGLAESNQKGVWNLDIKKENPLTEEGKKSVIERAQDLKNEQIDLIVTSPFQRTKETANLLREQLGLDESSVIVDDRLGEWNVGSIYEGDLIDNYFKIRNESYDRYNYKAEDGESYSDILSRAGDFVYDIDKKYSNKKIIVVSHGSILRAIDIISQGFSYKTLRKQTASFENYKNAELRKINFAQLPHNQLFELDLHRPYIDDVKLIGSSGEDLTRVTEVFDTWYDSGSMPFAGHHYPFENKEDFENGNLFPADFIAEGLDQTRGWFYTLLVLSTGLFDKSPYKQVVVNGLVLAEDGRKMSKSLNNYPDIMDVINKYGSDSLRYYLMASPLVKAEDFNFSEKGVDEVCKKLIQKLYNVLSFYEMYPVEASDTPKETVLDKWILSRLGELRDITTSSLDKYEIDRASRSIMDFVDDLSTWYLRRSRDRFKSDDVEIRISASYYLSYVLRELSKIIAPFTPFIAEEIYRRVGGIKESVHLEEWPESVPVDKNLIEKMKDLRELVTAVLELRQKAGHKVRQPLKKLKIKDEKFQSDMEMLEIIKDEVNVKEIEIVKNLSQNVELDTNITPELRNEGIARDIIRGIQDVRKIEGLNPSDLVKLVVCADNEIQEIIYSFKDMITSPTQVTDVDFSSEAQKNIIKLESGDITISLFK